MSDRTPYRYTLADVRASYGADKAADERHNEWAVHFIYRPLSFPLTPPLLNAGVAASTITLFALVVALGLPLFALAGGSGYLWVGLGGAVFAVLDCVDGNIARTAGTASALGGYLDFLTDVIYRIALYSAIGLCVPGALGWMLLAATLAVLARLSREYLGRTQGNAIPREVSGMLVGFVSGLDWLTPLALIALGALGLAHWLVGWLVVYSMLDFLHTQISAWQRLR